MKCTLKKLWRNEKGATAIEYGLIVALISIGLIVALTIIGQSYTNLYETIANKTEKASGGTGT